MANASYEVNRSMNLRERLSLLTKLNPEPRRKQAPEEEDASQETGLAHFLPCVELPASLYAYAPAADLASLAEPCLLPELARLTWEQVAFIDTETTGLSTGSGTYAFLVGIGLFTQGVLTIRQFFLPSPAKEEAFWQKVSPILQDRELLVSFNGKSYDLPLINSRLTLVRQPILSPSGHLDLLHISRRLWRRVLPSCALSVLERQRLGHAERQGDIAGAEIPKRYFAYLQTGEKALLEEVFRHNKQDIASLFELTVHLAEACAAPKLRLQRAEEYFGLADSLGRAGNWQAAAEAMEEGLELPGDRRLKQKYRQKLAKVYGRLADYEGAARVWKQLAEAEPFGLLPRIELSKLYEHRLRDLRLAWQMIEQASALARRRQSLGVPLAPDEAADLARRRGRILRKLEKSQQAKS